MWNRRMELGLLHAVQFAFRHLHPAMAHLELPQVAAWGEANKPKALEILSYLDKELAARRFIAGDELSVADITALCAVDFMKPARIERPKELTHVERWYREMSARPSAKA
jgi:glutathione S-transferase